VPAGREDVGQQREVRFVGCAGWEGEGVKIGVGDAEVLGLLECIESQPSVTRWLSLQKPVRMDELM